MRTSADLMGTARALADVALERERQMDAEGWTPEHDDEHNEGELADAAAAYAMTPSKRCMELRDDVLGHVWPDSWDQSWWKPTTRRRDLVKAAALLLAEIERIDRAEERERGKR